MNKIKLGKRTWVNSKGKKQKAHTFTYKENGKRSCSQSPNKKWLEQEAEQILFRIGNINPKNMNVDIPVTLSPCLGMFMQRNVKIKSMNQELILGKLHLKNTRSHYTHIVKALW